MLKVQKWTWRKTQFSECGTSRSPAQSSARALAIYDKIDYIKVSVDTAIARLGGTAHPKGYQRIRGDRVSSCGLDGKNETGDDIPLGPVPVKWSVEEFIARYDDDDKDFVGQLSPAGFFTPSNEGPNPKRKFSGNNVGDVWVVATYQPADDSNAKPLVGRCYSGCGGSLLYMRLGSARGCGINVSE